MSTNTTPVVSMTGELSLIPLLPGYRRVWSGRVVIGDYYLNYIKFWQHGKIDWARLSAAKIIEDGDYYTTADWFGCLTRETSEEKGSPCSECGCRSPLEEIDVCDTCLLAYYRADN